MEGTGNYYLINHLTILTGLSDRTIRNYLASGILNGEKINGLWHFTPDQVNAFIQHPAVRPSIVAKHNAIVYDFLAETNKSTSETCIILDIKSADKKEIAEFFCYEISNGNFCHINFAFDGVCDTPRVFLSGDSAQVLKLMERYHRSFSN